VYDLASSGYKFSRIDQGRWQKNFQRGNGKISKIAKKDQKNSTIKPLSTISVPCMKIQEGVHASLPSAADAHGVDRLATEVIKDTIKVCSFV